jgi:protein O-mannosyl-transferase
MSRPSTIAAIVFVSVLAVFGRLCTSEFTWYDDSATIHQNPSFNPPTWSKVMAYWTQWGRDAPLGLYIPLTYTVWGALAASAYSPHADAAGMHLNPWVFHSANVALHALSAVVVFALLRRLVEQPWAAGGGAMLFALHPVQVEAVAWVSGTKDVLCGLLSLVALWQYAVWARARAQCSAETVHGHRLIRGDDALCPGVVRSRRHYLVATIALVGALLSKPTAVVVPLIALLMDVHVMRTPLRRSIAGLLPWFVLVVPCIVWTKAAQVTTAVPVAPTWARPLIALDSIAFYLITLVWPVKLTVLYERTPLRVLENGWCFITWIIPAVLGIALLLNRKRCAELSGAGGIFVAGVLPVLGFVPFQFQHHSGVADHYLYLSMLGVALAVGVVLDRVRARMLRFGFAVVLVLLALLTFRQCGFWGNELRLWEHNLAVNPDSAIAHNSVGAALFRAGRLDLAESRYRQALRIKPDDPTAHNKLAQILVATSRTDEAIPHFQQVLRISGDLPPALRPPLDEAHNLLGMVLMSRGDLAQAIEHFRAALDENPQLESARQNLDHAERMLRSAPTTR